MEQSCKAYMTYDMISIKYDIFIDMIKYDIKYDIIWYF